MLDETEQCELPAHADRTGAERAPLVVIRQNMLEPEVCAVAWQRSQIDRDPRRLITVVPAQAKVRGRLAFLDHTAGIPWI